ncbi:hypothetical protein POM88_026599 [Heracleum sosnowskyi]|uniref:DUF4218 domain-containing protein n=1 Tax=Heracleum sosnowskyi TaxID=360622 RepID=A0AAD8I9G6_9APIA|nr:hypothetical protein POM88_026599 [Heracleum sosnowskyi]
MGIRKVLHPVISSDGKYREIRAAIFDMTNREKEIFCSVLEKAKLPYGCAANISRYVHTKERTIWGYKSHDAHFLLHYLLQFAVKKTLKPEVALPLIRLGAFLRSLWSKVFTLADLNRLEQEIIEILCHFEMIFPSAFFDIMIHLLVHLCKEIEYGGPAHLRCMWPIERYLAKLKSYVRNRSKPEGSIAEGYLAEECLTFCSRFLSGDAVPKFESCPKKMEYPIATKQVKRQFVTTHQLQQQKRNKKSTEVYTPRKSARLNNAQVTIPNQVKSSRKPELLKNQQTRRNSEAEVTSARNSARLVGARPEIIDAALKQKPKSVEEKSAQKSALIKNSQGIDENVDLKSGSVRRKLDLHNSIDAGKDVDEGEDVDGDENMDENDMEDDVLPPPPPLSPSSPIKPMKLSEYEMIKFLNMERNRQRCIALGVPELAVGVSAAFKKDKGKSKGKKNIRDEDEYIEESEEQSEDDASEILPKKTQKVKKNKVLNGPTTRSRSNAVTTTENGSTQNDKNEAVANSGMVEPAKTQLPCCQGLGSMVDYLAMRERKQKEAASAIATGSGTKNDKVPETDLPDIEMEEVEAVKVPKRLRGKTRMDKKRAERNAKSRRQYTDTHTAGPKLFSQIEHKMKNKQPDDEQPDDQQPDGEQPDGEQPDGEQPDDDLYYAKIFAKTRKRKPGRKYQSNPDVMEFRIDTINKKLGSSEGLDGLDELVSGAKKSHGRGWLIGRHDPKCLKTSTSAPAPTDSYVQELTKKIRQEVAVEVEAKVNQKVCAEVDGKINRKVQDNLTLALKKLAEANPTLNVDIGEICATISSDTVGDGTPMTNGPSS